MASPRISKELQFGVCNYGEPHASPEQQGEEKLFHRGKEEVGRAIVNKVHWRRLGLGSVVAFHCLSCDSLSLAELLAGQEEEVFFLLGSAMVNTCESSPFWPLNSILSEVSVY